MTPRGPHAWLVAARQAVLERLDAIEQALARATCRQQCASACESRIAACSNSSGEFGTLAAHACRKSVIKDCLRRGLGICAPEVPRPVLEPDPLSAVHDDAVGTVAPSMNWNALTRTKAFDLVMAAPLIAWCGYRAVLLRPSMTHDAWQLLERPEYICVYLQLVSLAAALAFNLLMIWLLLVRATPANKSRGLLPRLCALGGSFLGFGIIHLQPALLPLPWQALSTFLVLAGGAGSVIVLARLGKAFSIMPEARMLVTGGPYAFARHPLYAVEMIAIIGLALQFQQPWAGCLALGMMVLQVTRSIFEERVLVEAYPEYVAQRGLTAATKILPPPP